MAIVTLLVYTIEASWSKEVAVGLPCGQRQCIRRLNSLTLAAARALHVWRPVHGQRVQVNTDNGVWLSGQDRVLSRCMLNGEDVLISSAVC